MAERALKSVPPVREEAPDVRELPPATPIPREPAEQSPAPSKEAKKRWSKRKWVRWGLFVLLPIVLVIGGYWYVTGGQIMSTDDAYVDAEKVGVSTDVSGTVAQVDVTDNEHVAAGQVLYRLDPRQFQIALDSAKANLAVTEATVESMKQDYKRMLSDAAAQQSQVDLDQTNYNRDTQLLHSGTVAQANYDQVKSTLQTDKSKLESLHQQAQVQLAKLGGNPDILATQHPLYLQAQAQVEEAQRELNHTTVMAPFAGTVTNVSAIAAGKYLPASTTAFYLVDTDHAWVDANPKETELTYVRPGQRATVTVDAYPNMEWNGTVESISPAAAQEFSLLPAQNTSGNWVKVVQRVPMRVRVDAPDQNKPPLRAGMSVNLDVDTGHARGLPHFLSGWFGHQTRS